MIVENGNVYGAVKILMTGLADKIGVYVNTSKYGYDNII